MAAEDAGLGAKRGPGSDDEGVAAEKAVNEEYKLWKKNAPYLYDTVVTHALEWPSLTAEWLPDVEVVRDTAVHRLLLGTHTSDGAPNYVQLATVSLPAGAAARAAALAAGSRPPKTAGPAMEGRTHDESRGEWGGHGAAPGAVRLSVAQRIPHDGEVNRARAMPGNACVLATRAPSGEVHVFDYTRHASFPPAGAVPAPDLRLLGQRGDAYGLAWSHSGAAPELLAGASADGSVCVWDVGLGSAGGQTLQPIRTLAAHAGAAEDVSWQPRSRDVFASVGDDRRLCVWDLRVPGEAPVFVVPDAHASEVNCVAYAPANEWMVATGCAGGSVALWDVRKPAASACLHRIDAAHAGEVLALAWSPHMPGVFATGGADRRVHLWDLSRVGAEQDPEDAEDGPPELLFVHGGHTARVSDVAWCPNEPWLLASVAEDNICMVWQPAAAIYESSDDEDASDASSESADDAASDDSSASSAEDSVAPSEPSGDDSDDD